MNLKFRIILSTFIHYLKMDNIYSLKYCEKSEMCISTFEQDNPVEAIQQEDYKIIK